MCETDEDGGWKADVGSHGSRLRLMFRRQYQGDLFRHFSYPATVDGAGKRWECHQRGECGSDETTAGVGPVQCQ